MALVNHAGVVTFSLRHTTSGTINKGTTVQLICNLQLVTDGIVYQWNILDGDGVMGREDISQERTLVVSPEVTTSYQCIASLTSGDAVVSARSQTITINIPGMCYITMLSFCAYK